MTFFLERSNTEHKLKRMPQRHLTIWYRLYTHATDSDVTESQGVFAHLGTGYHIEIALGPLTQFMDLSEIIRV